MVRCFLASALLVAVPSAVWAQNNVEIDLFLQPTEATGERVTNIMLQSLELELEERGIAYRMLEGAPDTDQPIRGNGTPRWILYTEIDSDASTVRYRFVLADATGSVEEVSSQGEVSIDFSLDRTVGNALGALLDRLPMPSNAHTETEPSRSDVEAATPEEPLKQPERGKYANDPVEEEDPPPSSMGPPQLPTYSTGWETAVGFAALFPFGDASRYLDPLYGGDTFIGYSGSRSAVQVGAFAAVYAGTASGDALEAQSVIAPVGAEARVVLGTPPVTAAFRLGAGAALIRLDTEEYGVMNKVSPLAEGGLVVSIFLGRRLRASLSFGITSVFEQVRPILGFRPGFGLQL